jgi:hypothetical protein
MKLKFRRRLAGRAFRHAAGRLFSPESGIAWVFHSPNGEPCEACRLNLIHYGQCECGHCPPPVRADSILHGYGPSEQKENQA